MSPLRCAHKGAVPFSLQPQHVGVQARQGGSVLEVHDQLAKNNRAQTHLFGMHGALREYLSPSGFSMINDNNVSVSRTWKAARRLDQGRPHGSSETIDCQVSRRKSADGMISVEKQQHTPRRQLSLRKHR